MFVNHRDTQSSNFMNYHYLVLLLWQGLTIPWGDHTEKSSVSIKTLNCILCVFGTHIMVYFVFFKPTLQCFWDLSVSCQKCTNVFLIRHMKVFIICRRIFWGIFWVGHNVFSTLIFKDSSDPHPHTWIDLSISDFLFIGRDHFRPNF